MRRGAAILQALALLTFSALSAGWAGNATPPLPVLHTELGEAEARLAAATVQRALERSMSASVQSWQSPDGGASGRVTPLSTFQIADGRYCREYLEIVVPRGGNPTAFRSIACRNAQGLWLPITQ